MISTRLVVSIVARQPNEPGRIALVVLRSIGFHRRDLWIVKTLWTFAACDDDVALIKFEAYDAGHVTLRFCDERLQRFAFRGKPEAIGN